MKKCPSCAEEIQDEASRCRYCFQAIPSPASQFSAPSGPSGGVKAIAGLLTFVAFLGGSLLLCTPEDEPEPAVAVPAEELPHAPGVVRTSSCPMVAERYIKKMWKCGVNAEGFTEEQLCFSINTSTLRYVADLDTCTEFLVRSGIAK